MECMHSLFSFTHCVPSRVVEVSCFSFKIYFSLFHYTAFKSFIQNRSQMTGIVKG